MQGRRAATRNGSDSNGAPPSVLEILVQNFATRVTQSAAQQVKRGVHEVVQWTLFRLILGGVGAALVIGGLVLLLGAAVKGLEALRWPSWLAWLSTGASAVLVALVALRGILWPRKVREDD